MMPTCFCASANGSMSVSLTGVCYPLCSHCLFHPAWPSLSLYPLFLSAGSRPPLMSSKLLCSISAEKRLLLCWCGSSDELQHYFVLLFLKHIAESKTERQARDFLLSIVLIISASKCTLALFLFPPRF